MNDNNELIKNNNKTLGPKKSQNVNTNKHIKK